MISVSAEALLAISRAEAWAKLRDLTFARHYVPGVTHIEITSRKATAWARAERHS